MLINTEVRVDECSLTLLGCFCPKSLGTKFALIKEKTWNVVSCLFYFFVLAEVQWSALPLHSEKVLGS